MANPTELTLPFFKLGDFFEDGKGLDVNSFSAKHGHAFLLHHGPIGDLKAADPKQKTIISEGAAGGDQGFNPQADFMVFPVKRRFPPQPDDDFVWLGRSEDNDIVIPDASVSAVHAFIRKDAGGQFFLQDMNSMNGSQVNDQPVPAQGMGSATRIESGARIRLGALNLTFLEAPEFRTMIIRLSAW